MISDVMISNFILMHSKTLLMVYFSFLVNLKHAYLLITSEIPFLNESENIFCIISSISQDILHCMLCLAPTCIMMPEDHRKLHPGTLVKSGNTSIVFHR